MKHIGLEVCILLRRGSRGVFVSFQARNLLTGADPAVSINTSAAHVSVQLSELSARKPILEEEVSMSTSPILPKDKSMANEINFKTHQHDSMRFYVLCVRLRVVNIFSLKRGWRQLIHTNKEQE